MAIRLFPPPPEDPDELEDLHAFWRRPFSGFYALTEVPSVYDDELEGLGDADLLALIRVAAAERQDLDRAVAATRILMRRVGGEPRRMAAMAQRIHAGQGLPDEISFAIRRAQEGQYDRWLPYDPAEVIAAGDDPAVAPLRAHLLLHHPMLTLEQGGHLVSRVAIPRAERDS